MIRCNSCGGTYPENDGTQATYLHVCSDKMTDTYAVCNKKGAVVKPATFKPTPNPRNENLKPHPTEPGVYVMISEGSGVTKLEEK